MISLLTSFLHRVRIHGGEFDASARAMHRKAAIENVSLATIERKIMSTKTTLKRISLVAVAAMGIGLLAAVPSQAAPTAAYGTMFSGTAGNQIIGGQANVLITLDTSSAAISNTVTSTGVGSIASASMSSPGSTGSGGTGTVSAVSSNSFTAVGSSTAADATVNVVATSAVVGTQTISVVPVAANGTPGAAVTKTITWISGASNAVINHSTAFIGAVGSEVLVDATLTPGFAASSTAIGQIDARQYSDSGTTATATASTGAVTVAIAGAGSVSTTSSGGATGPSVTIAAGGGNANRFTFYVYANGVAGKGTVTISVAGAVVATKTVTFVGALSAYKATPTNTTTAIGGVADVVTISGLDANANAAALGTYYLTSSNTAVATVASGAQVATTFSVTGVALGTSVITFANAASSPTITGSYTVTVGSLRATKVMLSTDKSSYAAGEKITLTVTAVGSDGLAVGDKPAFAAFTSAGMVSNVALQGFPAASATVALVGGKATYTIYAPVSASTVVISAVEGADTTNVFGGGTAAAITTSFDVTNAGSDAATDAANAATDAANYAADAADAATTAAQEATAAAVAAQESADAATAAVVALGLRVDTLLASVRAQLTSLSNLLVRIIRKTHA